MNPREFGDLRSILCKDPRFAPVWEYLGRERDRSYLEEVLIPYCLSVMKHWDPNCCGYHVLKEGRLEVDDPRFLLVRSLYLTDTGISDLDAMHANPYLKNILSLRVNSNFRHYLGDEGLAKVVAYLPTLEQLHITQAHITDDGIKHFVSHKSLRNLWVLDLRDNPIKHPGMRMLANCPHLCNLQFLGVSAKYKGLEALLNSRHLSSEVRLQLRTL